MREVAYSIGVDLGQSSDWTAISVVETQLWLPQAVLEDYPWQAAMAGWNSPATLPPAAFQMALNHTHPWPAKPPLHLRHLERMRGKPYPEIVTHVGELLSKGRFADRTGYALVIDRTGVGMAV